MRTSTKTMRFIVDSFRLNMPSSVAPPYRSWGRAIAQLSAVNITASTIHLAINQLLAGCEHAVHMREYSALTEAAQIVLALPGTRTQRTAARYYLSLANRSASIQRALLYDLADSPPLYRPRITLALGANAFQQGDIDSASRLYLEAARMAESKPFCDPLTRVRGAWMGAAISGVMGDHRRAARDLEALQPLAETLFAPYPGLLLDWRNSLAVELGAVGRTQEALNYSRRTLASSLSSRYPAWRDTYHEIQQVSRPSPSLLLNIPLPAETPDLTSAAPALGLLDSPCQPPSRPEQRDVLQFVPRSRTIPVPDQNASRRDLMDLPVERREPTPLPTLHLQEAGVDELQNRIMSRVLSPVATISHLKKIDCYIAGLLPDLPDPLDTSDK